VVELFGWNNRTVRQTVGHIGESVEIGNIEMAMSPSTASQLGFDRPSAVIMWAFDEAALEAELALLPSSERWLTVNRSWVPSGRDSVLSTTVLKDLAGEPAYLPGGRGDAVTFQPGWTAENIAPVNVAILGTIRCNRVIADQLIAAFAEIEATGLGGLIDVADTRSNGGCFVPRTIRGPSGGNLSRHSWGVAIDVNPRSNPFGSAPTMDMHRRHLPLSRVRVGRHLGPTRWHALRMDRRSHGLKFARPLAAHHMNPTVHRASATRPPQVLAQVTPESRKG